MHIQSVASVNSRIFVLRGIQIMLDRDIAELYEIKPIRLREQVSRNMDRFPEDFMFQLNDSEVDLMVSQNAIPSRKHLGGSLPYAFTEQGVASLSGVIKSARAAQVHVQIMRAFVEMRRFIASNSQFFSRLDVVERRQISFENRALDKFEKIFDALQSSQPPKQGVFYNGQIFDAYAFVADLIRSARKSIVLIDNYIDDSVLTLLCKRGVNVSAEIHTKSISKQLALDLKKHNEQYSPIAIHELADAHDRFLIIDGESLYHIGASLKDLGKKWFAFSKFEKGAMEMLGKISLNKRKALEVGR